jgi:hypothetical protein
VADGLDELRGHRDRAQLPGHRQARQQLGVFAVGLDPIPRRTRRLARRDHRDPDPRRIRRAIEPEPGRAGLIDRSHRAGQARQPLHHRLAATVEPRSPKLTREHIDRRRMRRTRVDV